MRVTSGIINIQPRLLVHSRKDRNAASIARRKRINYSSHICQTRIACNICRFQLRIRTVHTKRRLIQLHPIGAFRRSSNRCVIQHQFALVYHNGTLCLRRYCIAIQRRAHLHAFFQCKDTIRNPDISALNPDILKCDRRPYCLQYFIAAAARQGMLTVFRAHDNARTAISQILGKIIHIRADLRILQQGDLYGTPRFKLTIRRTTVTQVIRRRLP